MRKFTSKRSALLAVIGVLVVSASAIAWLTATGSGTGTGNVLETSDNMTLTSAVDTFSNLGDSHTITVSALNVGSSNQHIEGVTIGADEQNGCPDGSFVVGPVTVLSAANDIAAGANPAVATATVTFTNLDEAQNACLAPGAVSFDLDSN